MGETFGRYRLEEQLGAGGVGEVWRAVDTTLDRVVALKTLLPRYRDDPDSAARFHREARLAARLRHPHIVRIHAFGEIDRRLFLDMELVEGDSLAAALAAGPLDPARASAIVDVVADALDTAHALDAPPEQRMVHRDVKPANILLEPRPRGREHAYLVDFGVARTVAAGPRITGVGAVVGTPAYMAPELWEGHDADHRVDVYALAVTAFELLTGTLPFGRGTLEGIVTAHLTEPPPPPSRLRPGLPAAVDAAIGRGMAKDPAARHPTAGDFADDLRAALRAPAPGPVAVTRPSRDPVVARVVAPTGRLPVAPRTTRGGPPTTVGPPTVAAPRTEAAPTRIAGDARRTLTPQPPDPTTTAGAAEAVRRRPYLASPPHFAGLATTALLVPLHLTGLVPTTLLLLAVAALLYALGAVLTAVLRRP